jgi:hypothetical protein
MVSDLTWRFRYYCRDRFYLRGLTWLGLLNTLTAALCNRVLVKCMDPVTGDVLYWRVDKGTDHEPSN